MTPHGLSWQERFWLKVDLAPTPDGCLRWTGALNGDGYGSFCIDTRKKRAVGAHRIAFFLANGHWPACNALHTCDHYWCVNAEHLYDGTQAQNVADMIDRNPNTVIGKRGATNHNARFTNEEATKLRQRYEAGESLTTLLAETQVDPKALKALLAGQSYPASSR